MSSSIIIVVLVIAIAIGAEIFSWKVDNGGSSKNQKGTEDPAEPADKNVQIKG